jgi:hypothetical protein
MVVIALAVTAVVAGTALPATVPKILDVGAWLANSVLGSVTHAEGPSGRADATVRLASEHGDQLKIIQSGSTILVQDLRTGVVSRIDPARLSVTQTASYGHRGIQVVAGDGLAYIIEPATGVIQRINPQTLSVTGALVRIGTQIGAAGISPQGTLWAVLPARGSLMSLRGGTPGAHIRVGRPGDLLGLTLNGNRPVVTDATAATMTVVGTDGSILTVALPSDVSASRPPVPLVPPTASGRVVPLVIPARNQLVVVNTASGHPSAVTLGVGVRDTLQAPEALGRRVYIPDETTGSLIVYDLATGRLLPPVVVTGHRGRLDVFVNDGMLWANDPNGPRAVAVNSSGVVRTIGKYRGGLPGRIPAPRHGSPGGTGPSHGPGSSLPVPSSGSPGPGRSPGPGHHHGHGSPGPGPGHGSPGPGPGKSPSPHPTPSTGSPSSSPSPSPTPSQTPAPPTAPGAPTATAAPGSIRITFTPSGGGTPDGYRLTGAPAGATVTPTSVPASGRPFQFTVTGLSCARQYTFAVIAEYSGGGISSPATAPMRPCVPPAPPRSLSVTGTANHAMTLGWSAPASDGGGAVTYSVSWSGAASGGATGLTSLSYQVTGLVNNSTYSYTVGAVSPAGASQPPASGSQALTPPPHSYNIFRNSQLVLNVRSGPGQTYSSVARIPVTTGSTGPQVTVQCQVTGGTVTDPVDSSLSGDLWDKLTYNGVTGYVSDLYVNTPQSVAGNYDSWSDPPVWQCQ